MSDKSISLDQLFEAQSQPSTVCTIEPIEGDTGKVRMTPWAEGQGCACEYSRVVPKDWIKAVTPTGKTHPCCGKLLLVVRVEFVHEIKLSSAEIGSIFAIPAEKHAGLSYQTFAPHDAQPVAHHLPQGGHPAFSGGHGAVAGSFFVLCGNCSGNYPANTRCCGHYVCPAGTECCNYLGQFRCCNNMGQPLPVGTLICGNP